ncbi:glycosyltransferase family 4 protein [Aquipseudomonas ullengensis]|uniref:Glycosyltransferase family 4 protein n=1 Tax=Aquipseudomonas ullengensis TaxID=2759166 RepID=A0A7W4QFP0_9GAMM|nr:glycosyltransferase family 1 protein [Pseudomonas ullengensis]MBB2496863.1 glycosyltransferase family 4 protein [Pseudomonas ullengensis]
MQMLKVGVDCRPLSRPLSGIGRYTRELLSLLTEAQDVHWFLYCDQVFEAPFANRPNVTLRLSGQSGSLAEHMWYQVALPRQLKRDGLDVFWSPRHHLPLFMPSSVRAVVTIHDLTWKRFPETMKPLQYWSERLQMPHSLRKAARIITISASSRSDLARYFPATQTKVHVIPCGVTRLEAGACERALPQQYLLFVGTPEPRKNIQRLLEAYAQLAPELRSAYPLVLAGGHGWMVDIEQLVDQLGIRTDVVALGAVSGAELGYIYSKARLLLMPSLYEGFGLPILEAFQFGVPVVTANCSSMPEVAGGGGCLVDPLQVESIRAGIERLLTDQKSYADCVAQITEQLARYDWKLAVQSTLEVLRPD